MSYPGSYLNGILPGIQSRIDNKSCNVDLEPSGKGHDSNRILIARGLGKGGWGMLNMENIGRHADRFGSWLVLSPALTLMPVPVHLADSAGKMEHGWWNEIREQAREEGSRSVVFAENPGPKNLPTIG